MSYYNERPQGYQASSQGYQSPSQGYQSTSQSYQAQPQVPYPWVAEWDDRDRRWIFINRENGERTFQHPQPSYSGGGGGYGERSYNQDYGGEERRGYDEQQPEKKDHHVRNTVMGAAAGVLGGALLMHEGEKVGEYKIARQPLTCADSLIEDRFKNAKYDLEDDARDGVQDVENFPDDVARWTGEKVQDVENIPQDIDRKWDNAVQDVEDVPDDVAGWTGRKVGDVERYGDDVERYGDNIDNSYDQGRNDARYDDDNRY